MTALTCTGSPSMTEASFGIKRNEEGGGTFSALEWLVVAIGARDSLDSLREPGRIALAFGSLLGSTTRPSLADSHLEELRRATVIARHHGHLEVYERLHFYRAGFEPAHYRLLCESIASAPEASVPSTDSDKCVPLLRPPHGSGLH